MCIEVIVCNVSVVFFKHSVFSCYCVLLDFSNALSKQDLKVLAEMDDQEVVREVQVSQEFF